MMWTVRVVAYAIATAVFAGLLLTMAHHLTWRVAVLIGIGMVLAGQVMPEEDHRG